MTHSSDSALRARTGIVAAALNSRKHGMSFSAILCSSALAVAAVGVTVETLMFKETVDHFNDLKTELAQTQEQRDKYRAQDDKAVLETRWGTYTCKMPNGDIISDLEIDEMIPEQMVARQRGDCDPHFKGFGWYIQKYSAPLEP